MADLSLVTDKFFTIASETFTDNLSSSIAAGAATVPVLNNSEYTNGDDVVLTVDPGTVNEATFIGRKSGLNFINCIWTEGNTAVGHANGATIIDYDSATHHNAQSKGILQFANSNGTLKTQPVRDALGLGAAATNGWEVLPYTLSVSSGYSKGNHEFDITVANNDIRSTVGVGTKLRFDRGTAAPTQCLDLELGTTQFASRASGSLTGGLSTITDDMTVEAWIKPESHNVTSRIATRFDGTNGWILDQEASGRITFRGRAGGIERNILSAIVPPWGYWTHIAGCLDVSGFTSSTCKMYFNGIDIPVAFNSTGVIASWSAVGPFQIGAGNGANSYDGKIADVRVWNTLRTATQIRDNMHQQLVGSETNLIGYWKLNGDLNDSTSSLNHLTGSGGAVATNADNPFRSTEYAIVTKVTYTAPNTILTVSSGMSSVVPNMTLSAPYYSVQDRPYGFPNSRQDWDLMHWFADTPAIATGGGWNQMQRVEVAFPVGKWDLDTMMLLTGSSSGAGTFVNETQWDTASPSILLPNRSKSRMDISSAGFLVRHHYHKQQYTVDTQTVQKLWGSTTGGAGTIEMYLEGGYIHQVKLVQTYF